MTYNMDGPYHGDPCASTKHPHHRGLEDSQWEHWKTLVEVIHELYGVKEESDSHF